MTDFEVLQNILNEIKGIKKDMNERLNRVENKLNEVEHRIDKIEQDDY